MWWSSEGSRGRSWARCPAPVAATYPGPVSTLSTLVARHAALDGPDLEWLHLLVGDWQVLSDLAFADLVLWLPTADGDFVAVAQCRPSTGATVHYDDVVGSTAPDGQRPQLQRSLDERAAQRSREPRWFGSYAVREEAVPVVRNGRPIAVLARQTNLGGARTPSRLELNYVEAADDIFAMVGRGEFPAPDAPTGPATRSAPRRRRARPPELRGRGALRQPERPVLLPPARRRRGPRRPFARRGDRGPHLPGGHGRRVDAAGPHGPGAVACRRRVARGGPLAAVRPAHRARAAGGRGAAVP